MNDKNAMHRSHPQIDKKWIDAHPTTITTKKLSMWSSLRGSPIRRISFHGNLQIFFKLKPFIIQNLEKNYLIQIIKFFEQATYKGCFFRYSRKHENINLMTN